MYLIIDKGTDNVIANISEKIDADTEQGIYSYDEDTFYPTNGYEVIEVESVPRGVHTYTHTYTEKDGFQRFIEVQDWHDMRIGVYSTAKEAKNLFDENSGKISQVKEDVNSLKESTEDLIVLVADIIGGAE